MYKLKKYIQVLCEFQSIFSMATHDQMTLILWNLTLFIYIHFPFLHYSKQPVKPISQAMSQLIGLSVIQKWNFTSKFVR